ncbi:MAG: DUF3048 domain-containing protein, partial [Actinomycetota bacterium]
MRRYLVVLLVAAFLLAACTSSTPTAAPTSPSPTPAASTPPSPPPPLLAPLTGLPVASAAILRRPALAIKIDNHTDARPHLGLEKADIVYE